MGLLFLFLNEQMCKSFNVSVFISNMVNIDGDTPHMQKLLGNLQ